MKKYKNIYKEKMDKFAEELATLPYRVLEKHYKKEPPKEEKE